MIEDEHRARLIALEAHGGQKDRDGKPHLEHVLRVAQAVEPGAERLVALLHDVLEDAADAWTGAMLKAAGFPGTVVAAVETLTRRRDETYAEYIERVAERDRVPGELARAVKLADLRDNLGRCDKRDPVRKRYEQALERLTRGSIPEER